MAKILKTKPAASLARRVLFLIDAQSRCAPGWFGREFNQDTSRAKRAAKRGPVFITDRGRPSHVLLTVEEYQKLTDGQKSIVDLLGMPQAAEVEFEPPRMKGNLHQPADLS